MGSFVENFGKSMQDVGNAIEKHIGTPTSQALLGLLQSVSPATRTASVAKQVHEVVQPMIKEHGKDLAQDTGTLLKSGLTGGVAAQIKTTDELSKQHMEKFKKEHHEQSKTAEALETIGKVGALARDAVLNPNKNIAVAATEIADLLNTDALNKGIQKEAPQHKTSKHGMQP